MSVKTAPYGAWESPISADDLAAGAVKFEQVMMDGDAIVWVESRPDEKGRSVAVRWTEKDGAHDVTPKGYGARTLVNSYGGGAVAARGDTVWFTNFDAADTKTNDQRVYVQHDGGTPEPLTPPGAIHYADMVPDAERGVIFCVMEDTTTLLHGQAQQTLVALDMKGEKPPLTVATGSDFYAAPALSPDGKRLAWITWDYPSMPWDGTRLQIAELDDAGNATSIRTVGGAPAKHIDPHLNPVLQGALRYSDEAILQPEWGADGTLYCVSDRTEKDGARWLNIYCVDGDDLTPVTDMAAEFAAPPWRLGGSSYAMIGDGQALVTYTQNGLWQLARVDLKTGKVANVETPYTSITHLVAGNGYAAFVGGEFTQPATLVRMDLATGKTTELRSANPNLSAEARACLAKPEAITFDTGDKGSGEVAHAFYHAPSNPNFVGSDDELPPLIIFIHGGPSAGAGSALSLDIAYFTSRGFGVADVNYRGSTGFGRAFHQNIYGGWGVVDVDDCVAAAEYLAGQGKIDGKRVASRGGSSGGYTTLALATFKKILSVGASYYGISDLEMIAQHTDKLEAHYAEMLVGPWPDAKETFKARSPLYHAGEIDCPLIIFQGEDDPVVPPKQAKVLIDAMLKRDLPVAWEFYPGESHGFRQKKHIVQSLEEEIAFYGVVMGFTPAGRVREPKIHNWPPKNRG